MSIKQTFIELADTLTFLQNDMSRPPQISFDNGDVCTVMARWQYGDRGVVLVFAGNGQACWSEGNPGEPYTDNIHNFNPNKPPPEELRALVKVLSVNLKR